MVYDKKLREFEDFKEFRTHYLRLGGFYGYMLGSFLTFVVMVIINNL